MSRERRRGPTVPAAERVYDGGAATGRRRRMSPRPRITTVGADGVARTACPACGAAVPVRAESPLRPGTPVRVRARCGCGRTFGVLMERRTAIRKRVELDGTVSTDGERERIVIHNLSRTGLLMSPPEGFRLRVGDRVSVRFELDVAGVHEVAKRVRVRRVGADGVGCEFTEPHDPRYDLALAQYRPVLPED